jgi:hypothetical protein
LLSERDVLQDQVGPAGEDRPENPERGEKEADHPRAMQAGSVAVSQSSAAAVGGLSART